MTVCAKMISSLVRKVLDIVKAHDLWVLSRLLHHLQLWWLVFIWHPSCRQVTESECLVQLDTIFST